jgi:thioredoxin reductase (NADPH)
LQFSASPDSERVVTFSKTPVFSHLDGTPVKKVNTSFDIIVVGGGPSGLSCAIEATKAGLSVCVLEKGSLVDSIRRFPENLVWFSTPDLLEIGGVPFVTSTFRPTRVETLNYYQRVRSDYDLDVRYFDTVVGIERPDARFLVTTARGVSYTSLFVVIATGYFDHPNRLGVPGEEGDNVLHYYDGPFKYSDQDVVVVGGRNSAVEAALDLYRHGARVTLVHRGTTLSPGIKYWVLPDIENRIKGKQIRACFSSVVRQFDKNRVVFQNPDGEERLEMDFAFVLTGFRPDVEHLSRFGIMIDPDSLAPRCDELTFETNLSGLFVAGSIVAGKDNNRIFIENGRLHGAAIVGEIVRRMRKKGRA